MLTIAGSVPFANVAQGNEGHCNTTGMLSHRKDRGPKFRFQGPLQDFVQSLKTTVRNALTDGRDINVSIDPNFPQVIILRLSNDEPHHKWGQVVREVQIQVTMMPLSPGSDEGVPTLISTSWIRKEGAIFPSCSDEIYHLESFHREVTLLLESLFAQNQPSQPPNEPTTPPATRAAQPQPASIPIAIDFADLGEQLESRLVVPDDAVTYETSVEALFMIADSELYDNKPKIQQIVDDTMIGMKDFAVKTTISHIKLKPINCMLNNHVLTIDLAASENDGAAAQVVIDTRIEYSDDPLIKAHMRILATPASRVEDLNYMTSDDDKKRIALASMTKILDELGNRLTAKFEGSPNNE